ncbi:MAG: hypothetical protein M1828_005522 [Chrysothrix sp. TS-e1954]|nr:MAG: hypothetical protein M1828_005522 [Chrysothrix sp. TS-e1954]
MSSSDKPVKVSLYNTTELKTTLDDHLPLYLSSSTLPTGSTALPKTQRFTPSHTLTNIRLVLGYSAVLIALYAFYQDWYLKLEFQAIKGTTFAAVCAYFILNSALTGWIWLVERGCIFQGSRVEGGKWGRRTLTVRSHAPSKKFEPVYKLEVSVGWSGGKPREGRKAELQAPFTRFFTVDSYFAPAAFEAWLQEQLPWLMNEGIGASGATPGKGPKGYNSSIGWDGYARGVRSSESEDAEETIAVETQSSRQDASIAASSSTDASTPRKRGRPKKNAS